MVSSAKKIVIWTIWTILIPAGIVAAYFYFPPLLPERPTDMLWFLGLMIGAALMPFVVNRTTIAFVQWISMTVFLLYGLFIEILFMHIFLVFLLLRTKTRKGDLYRYPLNSIMIYIVSLLSGLSFYALGGDHQTFTLEKPFDLLLVIGYTLIYFVGNQASLMLFSRLFYNVKRRLMGKDIVWELASLVVIVPLGMALFILYKEIGVISTVLLGIPFFSVAFILRLYYSTDIVNDHLQLATEIGHELTQSLKAREVVDLFMKRITTIVPVSHAYILDVIDNKELQLIRRYEDGENKSLDIEPLLRYEGISGMVWGTKKAVLYSSKAEWESVAKGYMPESVESILCVPIMRNQKVVGVLLLATTEKRAYVKYQLMIVDILCSYLAIALENARNYELTKKESERCALTGLYNYRYFERLIEQEYQMLLERKYDNLSLILIDIDHFKSINDTYGHQSGNEVLRAIADRLQQFIGDTGIVARYGGEEFVILLPNISKKEALSIAETLRIMIANRPFILEQQLIQNRKRSFIRITASIGVANAPEDADDYLTLIRHADFAMYVGAKRRGRNKVSEYQSIQANG
ncbi:diguanylate cyclase with GAF sensor [Bacillus oleivorans]|uniref:Diguanylate cyclase with GAF sensor n=1 Tax=Bacillus oleivorans TaxID=1448271 RepID=A0A285CWT4_9BACI|nr:sensor domain-containing diguanylate cyclase [Bacillus oleivorans]SNX71528.1 diguanylate cyclase with GAF sensor [Bacillus oleivorans]